MKKNLLILFLLTSMIVSSQSKKGNLLLLRIEKERDLKIEKTSSLYVVLELDSNYNLINDLEKSCLVYFRDFTDNNLVSCIKKDSINLKKLRENDTFYHDNKSGIVNSDIVDKNVKNMKNILDFKIKSPLYNQKIKVYYTFINCNYCTGHITKYDSDFIGYTGKIVLVIDDLTFDNKTKISKENMYSIIKQIDFNSHMF